MRAYEAAFAAPHNPLAIRAAGMLPSHLVDPTAAAAAAPAWHRAGPRRPSPLDRALVHAFVAMRAAASPAAVVGLYRPALALQVALGLSLPTPYCTVYRLQGSYFFLTATSFE